MATTLNFAGHQFRGIVLAFELPAPALQTYRTHFAGVNGVSEIVGGHGWRPIAIPIVVRDHFADRSALAAYTDGELNGSLFGRHGALIAQYSDGSSTVYDRCTFEGFFKDGRGDLLDEAGALEADGFSGWHCRGLLQFIQLRVV